MQASRFNISLPKPDSAIVYNTLSGRFVTMTPALLEALGSGCLQKLSPEATSRLVTAGVLTAKIDETGTFWKAARQRMTPGYADVTFLAAPSNVCASQERRAIDGLVQDLSRPASRHEIDSIKLRVAFSGARSARSRLQLFRRIRDQVNGLGIPVLTAWLSDTVQMNAELEGSGADAWFFLLDLNRDARTDEIADSVQAIAALCRNAMALIHISAASLDVLRAAGPALRQAARHSKSANGRLAWALLRGESLGGTYFRPPICNKAAHSSPHCAEMAAYLQRVGIPLQTIDASHICTFTNPNAWMTTWNGRRYHCFKDLEQNVPGECREPHPVSVRPCCATCAAAPWCLAECPRLAADDQDCLTRVRRELEVRFATECARA